jgi:UDP-N-acetylglucosamine acyltransferase
MPVDPSASIAPTARIHPNARIGPRTVVRDYCVIEDDVVIGADCLLEPYVFVKRWTTLGDGNQISAGTALGTDPLDKNFTGERSYLIIGNRNRIREHYTISRGTQPESKTVIGDDNYIMTSGHIAHNSELGNGITVASCALVAGHVTIEDQAFISGGVVIHQFSRIGRLAMIGGNVRVNQDAPPYFMYGRFDIEPIGLNRVGLRRAGFSREDQAAIKQAYRLLYLSRLALAVALERIEAEIDNPHARYLAGFVRQSKRGICRPRRAAVGEDERDG